MTLIAARTSREPAPVSCPAALEGPALTTSRRCMTEGSSPVRRYRSVGDELVNEARAENVTGSSLSSETLYAPDAGVVRPVRPTAKPER